MAPARQYSTVNPADSLESLLSMHGPKSSAITWVLLSSIGISVALLPFVPVDVACRAEGVVRAAGEREVIQAPEAGIIAEMPVRMNSRLRKDDTILVVRSDEMNERISRNGALQAEKRSLIADLGILTRASEDGLADDSGMAGSLATAVAKQSLRRLRSQLLVSKDALFRAEVQLKRASLLANKNLITAQELDDAQYEVKHARGDWRVQVANAIADWQAQLRDDETALGDLVSEERMLRDNRRQYRVAARSDGFIVDLAGVTVGSFVLAGQQVATVSPDDSLIIEANVSSADIGKIYPGQLARLQVYAYHYTEWGILEARVQSVPEDASTGQMDAQGSKGPSLFKVLLRPESTILRHSNGAIGTISKGMTVSARFVVGTKSLLQLLVENVSGWIDPRAPRAQAP